MQNLLLLRWNVVLVSGILRLRLRLVCLCRAVGTDCAVRSTRASRLCELSSALSDLFQSSVDQGVLTLIICDWQRWTSVAVLS
jgi:hypothetical protein